MMVGIYLAVWLILQMHLDDKSLPSFAKANPAVAKWFSLDKVVGVSSEFDASFF
jgi:hypothetical protein